MRLNLKTASVMAMAIAGALSLPASAAPSLNACYTTTRSAYVASCTMVPSTSWLYFSCSAYSGATGTITIVQHVFSNTQACPRYQQVSVVPGVPVSVTLRQTNTSGFLEGGAWSTIG